MGVIDIGALRGVLELKDDYTSVIDLASITTEKFSKKTQASFTAIAEAGGLVTATFTAIAVAATALGERGSDVNDVASTLDHFAGSSENAKNILEGLRAGTKNTVDDFLLMKDAAHLLSAGVNLTAQDFGVLGSAAFVLQNRGLGPTKVQLDLVSDALVTGKTKALAHALGVVEVTNQQETYAKSLGITVAQLSKTGVAEANRIAVMGMLSAAVKDAGNQERDFGEKIEAAKTFVTNYIDDLARMVAVSPVLSAGMDAVGAAVNSAFGSDRSASIKTVAGFINDVAISATYVADALVTTAKIGETLWNGEKTAVLAVETAVIGLGDAAVEEFALMAKAAAALHLISPDTLAGIIDTRSQLRAMTSDLASQTVEAAKSTVGHTAFDDTLDKLSGTILNVRNAMVAKKDADSSDLDSVKAAGAATDDLAARKKKALADSINAQKVEDDLWKIQEKSLLETSALWEQYFAIRTKNTSTSFAADKAAINAWRNDEIAKLDASDKNWKEHFDAINAVADQKLKGISSFYSEYQNRSTQSLDETAQKWDQTIADMEASGQSFSRVVWDEVIAKQREAARGATEYGSAATDASEKVNKELEKTAQNLTTINFLDKSSPIATTEDNFHDQVKAAYNRMANDVLGTGTTTTADQFDSAATTLAHAGYSLDQIVWILKHPDQPKPKTPGPRIPGFVGGLPSGIWPGGLANMNEAGPETIYLPPGAGVAPHGANGGVSVHVEFTPGSVVWQYPIVNDRQAKNQFGEFASEAIIESLASKGVILGQR